MGIDSIAPRKGIDRACCARHATFCPRRLSLRTLFVMPGGELWESRLNAPGHPVSVSPQRRKCFVVLGGKILFRILDMGDTQLLVYDHLYVTGTRLCLGATTASRSTRARLYNRGASDKSPQRGNIRLVPPHKQKRGSIFISSYLSNGM